MNVRPYFHEPQVSDNTAQDLHKLTQGLLSAVIMTAKEVSFTTDFHRVQEGLLLVNDLTFDNVLSICQSTTKPTQGTLDTLSCEQVPELWSCTNL